jgi:hypothetical protein
MGDIPDKSPQYLINTIRESNEKSKAGSQRYLFAENEAIQSDFEFINCSCTEDCWCKKNGCIGHYRIREINFDRFLETYVHLWIPPKARDNVRESVLNDRTFNGRQRKAIPHLQWLMRNWADTLSKVRKHKKCGLCDNGIPTGYSANNLYQAKMWSQLFYDSLVPFDSKSRIRITRAGYTNPLRDFTQMNREIFIDLRQLASRNNLDVGGLRSLDKPWIVEQELASIRNGQPLSRVLDKMFYSS